VLGDRGKGRQTFREFVVFHSADQVLPEFLVAYHRTNGGVPIQD